LTAPVEERAVILVGLDALLKSEGRGEASVGMAEVELFVEKHEHIVLLHQRVHLQAEANVKINQQISLHNFELDQMYPPAQGEAKEGSCSIAQRYC
jgi:hypothetical protein